jgi:hypothetical protein
LQSQFFFGSPDVTQNDADGQCFSDKSRFFKVRFNAILQNPMVRDPIHNRVHDPVLGRPSSLAFAS